jgi:hypothetical protein
MKPVFIGKPLTQESRHITQRRAIILHEMGPKWVLHPDNSVKRLTPMPPHPPAPAPKAST